MKLKRFVCSSRRLTTDVHLTLPEIVKYNQRSIPLAGSFLDPPRHRAESQLTHQTFFFLLLVMLLKPCLEEHASQQSVSKITEKSRVSAAFKQKVFLGKNISFYLELNQWNFLLETKGTKAEPQLSFNCSCTDWRVEIKAESLDERL